MLNEYWFLAGWYIFDQLDKLAHREAKDHLGKCVTSDASIKYLAPMNLNFDKYIKQLNILKITDNVIIIELSIENYVHSIFTFVKLK